jgi:DNA-binding IclR family transcriptional regulator
MMKSAAYPGTQAVQRAMTVLKAVAQGGPETRLADVTRQVGLNKSTVFRLLSALESAEMIERTPGGDTYRLGRELVRMASQALGKNELVTAARPTLQALAAETRETITLEVLVGDEMLILDELVGGHVVGAMPSMGTRWPAHATSTGKVVWAHLPPAELEARLLRRLPSFTSRTVCDPAQLRRELERVRVRGYATAIEELEPGFVAVGTGIFAADGEIVAAISVGGPRSRLTPAAVMALAARLPAAGREISERLGHRGTIHRGARPLPSDGRTRKRAPHPRPLRS